MQIAQPPRQLQGWIRLQMKDIENTYNIVKSLQWEFSCIVDEQVANTYTPTKKGLPLETNTQFF